jgi:hypothetical protein
MLRLSFVLMSLFQVHAIELSYFDSATEPKYSWVIADSCAVKVEKAKVKDTCYIVKKVNNYCQLDLDLRDCENK